MRISYQNRPFHFMAAGALFLVMLAGCSMPDQPDGANVEGLTHIADKLRAEGDDAGALDFYQRALQRNPNNLSARIALAQIYEAHGDNANALIHYREALREEADDGDLLRAYGRALIKSGQPKEAKAQYEKALKQDSDDVKALNGLGVSLDYLGQHDAAQRSYKQALDNEADDLVTMNNLAHSYVLVGSYDQAIALLEPHLKDGGMTTAMRQNLAEAYGMAGMDVDAERVGLMDLKPDQVKRNLNSYRARRAKLALQPTHYADLGSFSTQAMAEAVIERIKEKFSNENKWMVLSVKPEVKAIGGTPSFTAQITGFTKPDKVKSFCEKLKTEKIVCKAK